jgi:hypothetical protein
VQENKIKMKYSLCVQQNKNKNKNLPFMRHSVKHDPRKKIKETNFWWAQNLTKLFQGFLALLLQTPSENFATYEHKIHT